LPAGIAQVVPVDVVVAAIGTDHCRLQKYA
jgi:tRNA A22 N-methylase